MNFRHDIQALRGFAVLIILLYHAGIGPLSAGYLGVDIFFVISGFLITSLLIKHMEMGDFSFREFYFRRAKRLLPAAYVVLLLTTLASLVFMVPSQYHEYKNQLLGALTFTANFSLLDQADYFAGAAKDKPLLHMWSLAIEEQFYLILPLLIFFLPRHRWKRAIVGLFSVSLLLCLARVANHPDQTFYMLPTRMWELLIGSMAALYIPTARSQRWYGTLFYPALAVLAILPIIPITPMHPSVDALLVCLATFVLIQHYTARPMGKPIPLVRALSRVGDYSYSLYLVHWPLYAYARNIVVTGELTFEVRLVLLVASCVGAVALYHAIERPLHRKTFSARRNLVIPLVLAAAALAGLTTAIQTIHNRNPGYQGRQGGNFGLGRECDQKDHFKNDPSDNYKKLDSCQTSETPKTLIWGDSYAMQWINGMVETSPGNTDLAQATRRSCSPLTTLSYQDLPKYHRNWSERCVGFNRDVLAALASYETVDTVVLSGIFEKVVDPKFKGVRWKDGAYEPARMGPDIAVEAMADMVKEIRAQGKKVVVLSPPPKNRFNVGLCLEKLQLQSFVVGKKEDCSLSLARAKRQFPYLYNFLDRLPTEANVPVIYLTDYLCEGDVCHNELDGVILYKDDGHVTPEASRAIVERIGLLKLLRQSAR